MPPFRATALLRRYLYAPMLATPSRSTVSAPAASYTIAQPRG
jgi:hypothetical protein